MDKKKNKRDDGITIDSEFQKMIPPLRPEELAALEQSILTEGCRHPLIVWKFNGHEILVDGHNRHRLCRAHDIGFQIETKDFASQEEAMNWIIQNQMARRNLSRFAVVELQLKRSVYLKELAKANQRLSRGRGQKGLLKSENLMAVHVDKEVAIASGVSPNTVRQAKFLIEHATAKIIQELRSGNITINAVHREVKRSVEQQKRKAQVECDAKAFAKTHPDEDYGILHGDFREIAADIPDGSVDLILVDPEYAKKASAVYDNLGQVAARVLKPNGSVLVYCGTQNLAAAITGVSPHVPYFWTLAARHDLGHEPRLVRFNVINRWKPIVWFQKGKRSTRVKFLVDPLEGSREKDAHEWQQSLREVEYLIEYLTKPGDLVLDCFCGSGTTGLACARSGRRWICGDSDLKAVRIARKRIGEFLHQDDNDDNGGSPFST